MKLLTRITFACFFAVTAHQSYAQVAWNEIPAIPVNPSAGQTSPQSYDVAIDDDGRMFASYIFDNGTNQQIYIQEYVAGTGWTLIYNDFVYSGFEAIHSFKLNGVIYVMVKRDDAVATQQMRLYSIFEGNVAIVNTFNFADLPNGADYRAVVSEDGSYVYMLHKNDTQSSLVITQFNVVNANVSSLIVPTGLATSYNYDLVEHQDTVYIGLTRDELANTYRTYLHKVDNNMLAVVPHHPGNVNGQMGLVGPSTTLMGLSMGKNPLTHDIHLLTRDESFNVTYKFTPATLTTTFATSSMYYSALSTSPSAYSAYSLNGFHFGSFNTVVSPTGYATQLVKHNYATDEYSSYSGFDFDAVGEFSTNCHFGYAESIDRAIAVLYDGIEAKTRYYYSNHIPTVSDPGTVTNSICPLVSSTLVSGLEIEDIDGQPIFITNVSAADQGIFPNGTITSTLVNQVGNNYTFNIEGTPLSGGSTTLTITFTDGINTGTTTVNVNVLSTGPAPTFNQSNISFCSNNGMIDMSPYVSVPGGEFGLGGVTGVFDGPNFNSNITGIPFETQMQLDYSIVSIGCTLTASANFTFHESASVTVAATPTTCGGTTGSAIATIAGGTIPYLLQAWSTGQTNVTSVNGLSQGTHTFTVQDANLCSVIKEFTIVPSGVDIVPTITNVSCYGANDGAISTTLSGFTAPTTMIWSSGYSVPAVSNLVPGTYTLTVTDASNCVYTEAFTVTQPTQLEALTVVTSPTCGNTDGAMEVQTITGGSGTYDVSWSTGGTNALETNVGYGVYSATITDNTGCQTIKTVYVSELNSGNLYGTITGSQCGSNTGAIDVTPALVSGANVQAISWSSGEDTEDISMKPAATYVCTLTTDANCHAVRGWNIPIVAPALQPICVVTVDSVTSTNLVVWEDVQTVGIHHYNIYRETSIQGEYILIDTVEATNTSLFNDVVASPIARSWSYKISAVNGCNVEGPISAQHRTMHLSAIDAGSQQTQISWNAYEGTAYSNFVLWRYTDAALWEEVATLPVTQVSYIDGTDFITPGLDYMVQLDLDEQCTALKYLAQDFNTTRSNKDKGNFLLGQGTGDSNNDVNELLLDELKIYPNPTSDLLTLVQTQNNKLNVRCIDLSGKEVATFQMEGVSNQINISGLENGAYLIEIELNGAKRVTRIVKL